MLSLIATCTASDVKFSPVIGDYHQSVPNFNFDQNRLYFKKK